MTQAKTLLDEANRQADANEHAAAVDLASQGLSLNPPHALMIDLHERISISGFYSSKAEHKQAGYDSCEKIASDRTQGWHRKNLARQNITWYAKSLKDLAPSTTYKQIEISLPDRYVANNPSITTNGDEIWMIQRTVNYLIRSDGSYDMRGDSAIRTTNYMVRLDNELNVVSCEQIKLPKDLPEPKYNLVLGFEDSRLFFWRGDAWCTSTFREATEQGWCEIVLAKITNIGSGECELTDWRVINPTFCERQNEKNWMPLIINDNLYFIYSSDPARIIDANGNLVSQLQTSIAADSYRGGGAAVHFDGGYLTLLHESTGMSDGRRRYMHRFAWYDRWGRLSKISPTFYIKKLGIEFSPGLAKHPNKDTIIVSFGLDDRESWLAELSANDLRAIMKPAGLDKQTLADDFDTMKLVISETNKALDTQETVRLFQNIAIRSGLPLHEDAQKNWDSILATYWATMTCDTVDPVMDVAATKGSAFLPGLRKLGFHNLISINLTQKETEVVNGISYQYGDCTATNFQDNYFGYISCLSVIEHGVDVDRFLAESHRILKKNGYLFISTDYWIDPVDTFGQTAFGAPVKVFDKNDIISIIEKAKGLGFELTTNCDLNCKEKTVEWIGMQYTFINLLFQKK